MTIFNLQDNEAYYESDEAYLVVDAKVNDDGFPEIKYVYGLFEKREDAKKFAIDFGNGDKSIRVMPIPFMRSKI